MADETRVAVLGAGSTMGLGVAGNIARAGIRGRRRDPDHVADADAVIGAIEDAVERVQSDAIWLQMSTIGEAGTDRCAEVAEKQGLTLIDAPVLCTKQPAEEGKLVVIASGPEAARERVQPIFDAVGHKTIWVGEAGAGTRLKMVANSWVLTVVEGVAETFALAEGLDLDPSLLLDAIEGGTLDLPYLRMKGQAIIERNFEPSFRLLLAAKDARLIEESAERHEIDLPLFSTIRRRLAEAAKEHGDEDFSATYWTSAPRRDGA